MTDTQHYILFPNHDNAMRLYNELKTLGVGAVIAPTPRSVSKCCGVSLLVKEEDIGRIERCIQEKKIGILQIASIEKNQDPKRDKYC